MTDTHTITSKEYLVVERVIDCDGSCVESTGAKPQSTIEWAGLPRSIVEKIERLSIKADPPP